MDEPHSPQPSTALTIRQQEQLGLLLTGSMVVTIVLYSVHALRPIARPLLLLSTFAHEMGHGLAAMLVGGKFQSLVMFSDGSGYASMLLPNTRMAAAISSMGGLLGPAIVASILLVLGMKRRWANIVVWTMSVLSLLMVIWVVRSWFGVFFIGGFAFVCAAIAYWAKPMFQQFWIILIATQLGMAVFSRADYLFTPYAETARGRMPSDVMQISHALFGPYWFWGVLIAIISVVILGFSVRIYFNAILQRMGH